MQHWQIVALPDGAVEAELRAVSDLQALRKFKHQRGIVGRLEGDPEHDFVLRGDRLVYAARPASRGGA